MAWHGLAGHHSSVIIGLGWVTLLRRDTVGRHPGQETERRRKAISHPIRCVIYIEKEPRSDSGVMNSKWGRFWRRRKKGEKKVHTCHLQVLRWGRCGSACAWAGSRRVVTSSCVRPTCWRDPRTCSRPTTNRRTSTPYDAVRRNNNNN